MARVLNSVHGVKETSLMTPLTIEEQQFVDAYIKLGVGADAVRAVYPEACAKSKAPEYATHRATALLNKPNIEAAILRRMEEMRDSRIADSKEVMEYSLTRTGASIIASPSKKEPIRLLRTIIMQGQAEERWLAYIRKQNLGPFVLGAARLFILALIPLLFLKGKWYIVLTQGETYEV